MPKYQFPIDYPGTKFVESGKYLNPNDYANYSTIIEPFGGTFGFSRWLYSLNPQSDRNFIICDNNEELITTYNSWKAMTKNEYIAHIQRYNDIFNALPSTGPKKLIDKADIRQLKKDHPEYKLMIEYNLGRFTYLRTKDADKCAFWYDMFQKTTFIFVSSTNLMIHDIPNAFVYIDPPYIMECNSSYFKTGVDYSRVIYDAMNEFKHAASMFIHSEHFLLTFGFGKWEIMEYSKKYGMSKRVVTHKVYVSTP